jgi:putative sigma-54 modulation protein
MRITELRAQNIELTEAIRTYVEEKILSLEKFTEGWSPCDATVDIGKTSEHHQKGDIWRAAVTVKIPGGTLRVERIKDDLYAAIDTAKDDLRRQILDRKG